jgi:hypothetical protein
MFFNKEIKAIDGCIIYFPTRKTSSKQPFLIKGADRAITKRKEEWTQIRVINDVIPLEDRKENDKAANVGNSLFCEIITTLKVVINKKYNESIPLIVEKLLCSTTSDPTKVINSSYFSKSLEPIFLGVIQKVISTIDYFKLLTDGKYKNELEAGFNNEISKTLTEYGFEIIETSIRFTPLRPVTRCENFEEINDKFVSWSKMQKKAELEEKKIQLEAEQGIQDLEKADKLKTQIKNNEYEEEVEKERLKSLKALSIIEQHKEEEVNNKKQEISKQQKILEDFYNTRREEKDQYEHIQGIEKIKRQKSLQDESDQIEIQKIITSHNIEIQKLEYDKSLLDKKIDNLPKLDEITRREVEIKKIQGHLENELELLKITNANFIESQVILTINKFIEKMPEIVNNLPKERTGDTTLITLGKGEEINDVNLPSILGFSLLPVIKNFLKEFSNKLSTNS